MPVSHASRRIVIVAGPNGAGKTTFARRMLAGSHEFQHFVNADVIAAAIAPLDPARVAITAARLMLAEIDGLVARGESFALETTISGRHWARLIPRWQAAGFHVRIVFIRLANPEKAIARVASRVRHGGHDIPLDVIRRRFHAGHRNFVTLYRPLADAWSIYDNDEAGFVPATEGSKMTDQGPPTGVGEAPPMSDDTKRELRALREAAEYAWRLAIETGTSYWTTVGGVWTDANAKHLGRPRRYCKSNARDKELEPLVRFLR